jgi:hypothetical protein
MYHYLPEDTTNAVWFTELVSINYWNLIEIVGAVFKKISILCFGADLKLEFSYPADTDLWQTHSWMLTMTEICRTIQAQATCTSIHTYRQRYIKNLSFFIPGAQNSKSVKILRLIFFTFTVPSHVYMYEKVSVKLCHRLWLWNLTCRAWWYRSQLECVTMVPY